MIESESSLSSGCFLRGTFVSYIEMEKKVDMTKNFSISCALILGSMSYGETSICVITV